MVQSKTYKGIEYIQLSALPKEQYESFLKSASGELIIKIKVNEEILADCVQYKDYVSWFKSVYTTTTQVQPLPEKQVSQQAKWRLAPNHS